MHHARHDLQGDLLAELATEHQLEIVGHAMAEVIRALGAIPRHFRSLQSSDGRRGHDGRCNGHAATAIALAQQLVLDQTVHGLLITAAANAHHEAVGDTVIEADAHFALIEAEEIAHPLVQGAEAVIDAEVQHTVRCVLQAVPVDHPRGLETGGGVLRPTVLLPQQIQQIILRARSACTQDQQGKEGGSKHSEKVLAPWLTSSGNPCAPSPGSAPRCCCAPCRGS